MKILNSVFIQPTYSCALNCKGCYVKESVQARQMDRELLSTLIRYLWISSRYNIRQITLAVDNLPEDPDMKNIMVHALEEALRLKSLYGKKIELHITVNSMEALLKYVDTGISLKYIGETVDLVSFSHLREADLSYLRYLRSFSRVNYNYIPSSDLDEYRNMLGSVDMSYLIFMKTGLGRLNDPRAIQKYKDALVVIKDWDSTEKNKITIDGCIRDAAKYQLTGFGCSANISRLHIWPDGHVTGCPYNKDGGNPARNMTSVIDNIEEALDQYEFRSCTIPRDYFSTRPTLRVIG